MLMEKSLVENGFIIDEVPEDVMRTEVWEFIAEIVDENHYTLPLFQYLRDSLQKQYEFPPVPTYNRYTRSNLKLPDVHEGYPVRYKPSVQQFNVSAVNFRCFDIERANDILIMKRFLRSRGRSPAALSLLELDPSDQVGIKLVRSYGQRFFLVRGLYSDFASSMASFFVRYPPSSLKGWYP